MKRIATIDVPPEERGSYWREMTAPVYAELEFTNLPRHDFQASLEVHSIADMELSRVSSEKLELIRSPRSIARSSEDAFLISLQAQGQGYLQQGGRSSMVNTGDLILYDTTRPYRWTFQEQNGQIILKVPRNLLLSKIEHPEGLTAHPVSGQSGMGRIATDMLRATMESMPDMDETASTVVAVNLVDMLTAAIGYRRTDTSFFAGHARTTQLTRIKAFIRLNLKRSDLSVPYIAECNGISLRYLHRLFEHEAGTVSQFIMSERLQQCRDDLSNRAMDRVSITDIGYRWGFNDSAHFSRSFKKVFGMSPKEYRKASAVGEVPIASLVMGPQKPVKLTT